jgi:hypothetical protein
VVFGGIQADIPKFREATLILSTNFFQQSCAHVEVDLNIYNLQLRTRSPITDKIKWQSFSKLSDKIFLFELKHSTWSEVMYPRTGGPQVLPPEMAFHTAALVASYMIIYGGYTHKHNRREVCYSADIYFYHLDCHVWVSSIAMEHRLVRTAQFFKEIPVV